MIDLFPFFVLPPICGKVFETRENINALLEFCDRHNDAYSDENEIQDEGDNTTTDKPIHCSNEQFECS